jgi:hypothetical protein
MNEEIYIIIAAITLALAIISHKYNWKINDYL